MSTLEDRRPTNTLPEGIVFKRFNRDEIGALK
jgi:hypothetical protein